MAMQISGVTIQGGMNILPAGGSPSPAPTPGPSDPDFSNVVFMFDGDGTNGGANNTFTDSSTNSHAVTESGSVVQGSFSPYGDHWSNYFDGSSTILDVSGHPGLNFGSGDFTLECFVSLNSNASTYQAITDPRGSASDNVPLLSIHNTGVVYYFAGGSTRILGTTVLNTNQWYHIALVKNSGTTTLYLDGSSEGSFSDGLTYIQPTTFRIGQRYTSGTYTLDGYLSNVRVVKGTALYTSAFTPPTDPLTVVNNTELLTCSSNRFVDESTNNSTITISGTPKVAPFSPFKNSDARNITVDGGSASFKGDGDDYLTSGSTALIHSGSFTVEGWIYPRESSNDYLIAQGTQGGPGRFNVGLSSGDSFTQIGGDDVRGGSVNTYSWNHLAATYNSSTSTLELFLNGVSQGTTSVSDTIQNTTTHVGILGDSWRGSNNDYYALDGLVSNIRVVESVIYTTNFTPPTSPLTAVTNTELLLNFQDSAIYDYSGLNNIDTIGNAQIDTAIKKFGTGSVKFDGSGDYLIAGENPNLAPGAGDFTVEFWMYGITNNFYNGLYHNYTDAFNRTTALRINTNNADQTSLMVQTAATTLIATSSGVVTASAWNHIALVRNGSSLVLYVNGTSAGSTTNTTNFSDGYAIIGNAAYNNTGYFFNGYIDDFRVTKGVARYTSNFTPPTAALPKY
jgi:hypothetical protein